MLKYFSDDGRYIMYFIFVLLNVIVMQFGRPIIPLNYRIVKQFVAWKYRGRTTELKLKRDVAGERTSREQLNPILWKSGKAAF